MTTEEEADIKRLHDNLGRSPKRIQKSKIVGGC